MFVCLWIKTLLNLDCVAFTQYVSTKHLENLVSLMDQNICTGLWMQLRAVALLNISAADLAEGFEGKHDEKKNLDIEDFISVTGNGRMWILALTLTFLGPV